MVKHRHFFNGKNGIKMLRIGGISMLISITSPTAFAHLAKDATMYASTWHNQSTVRGTVKDSSNGLALSGVTVTVKGTNQATTTDENGNFELEAVPGTATLVFTSVGMESKEVAVSNQTTFNVSLDQSLDNIDEVVVVGYGTQKKATVTGSVAAVKGDELKNHQQSICQMRLQAALRVLWRRIEVVSQGAMVPEFGFVVQIPLVIQVH